MILAGDVGGTKTLLALFERDGGELRQRAEASFRSADHGSLEEIAGRFLADRGGAAIEAACFGVAGAVVAGRARITNLDWPPLAEDALARAAGAPRAVLLNDLQATAYGILDLDERQLFPLNPGAERSREANAAVIAAGTGLGEAILFWDGRRHRAIATESGHADFAPRDDVQLELLRSLRAARGGRVSVERVLSGPGLRDLYAFLRRRSGAPEPAWLADAQRQGDPSAAIAEAGLAQSDEVCAEALRAFASIYGAEAGDLALRCLAVGGVFVGGGIAPKILPALTDGGVFLRAFSDKGRFSELLAGVEVSVALEPRAALLGAARHAAQLAE